MITDETVEENMPMLKGRKQVLADSILSGGSGTTLTLTEAGLELLFGYGLMSAMRFVSDAQTTWRSSRKRT